MTFPNLFTKAEADQVIGRINQINHSTKPLWGKMNAAQMMAHCTVAYETVYTDKYPKPNPILKFIIELIAKKGVVGLKPYPKNSRTAPHFIIADERDFEKEKAQLISYVEKTQELGEGHFDGKESHSFGPLTTDEWNSLFYKHLNHHLEQFGV